jgi:tRNA U55 pseudouridine synthase TruB
MIIEFEKNIGETMDEVIRRFKNEYLLKDNIKIAYAGRLDPLAFGKIILLTEDDIYIKDQYCGKNKTYTCTIVHGIQTDTFDIMGKIISENEWKPIYNNIKDIEYEQIYPMYSSIHVIQNGMRKPLWYYEKNNIKVENMPSKRVKLLNGEKISNDLIISSKDLFDIITNRINKVKKDTYRQEEIINLWKKKLSNLDDSVESSIKLSKWEFDISSGGYIRYLANKMNGCCFDIQRIRYYDL